MPRLRLAAATALAGVTVLTACAAPHSLSDPVPSGVPTPTQTEVFGEPAGNDLIIRYDDTELHVETMDAVTSSSPIPDDLPMVEADELAVFVRADGWMLSARQLTGDPYECGQRTLVPEQRELGGGWWAITPGGPAGEYTLAVSAASGPGLPIGGEVGEAGAYIALTTTEGRPVTPGVLFSVDAWEGNPGWVFLGVTDLAESPGEASASVRFTGDDGASVDVDLTPTTECSSAGEVSFDAELDVTDSAALAGRFDYEIELVLDNTTYRARGSGEAKTEITADFRPALKGFGSAR